MPTSSLEDIFSSAYGVASSLLLMENPITEAALDRAVAAVGAMPAFLGLDLVRLKRALEAKNNIRVGGYAVIDDRDFKAWVKAAREARQFQFWERYRHWLEKRKRFADDVVLQLDRLTDDILDRLRDPNTPGAWDRRGLVVGDVQSGKTANYTGLICKAVDAGFPLIIVLAGVHNSLRSQTQLRMDEGFLGFDTRLNLRGDKENQRVGAGGMPGAPFLIAHSLTSSSDSGDFKQATAQGTSIVPGGRDPVILVVKKRCNILRNLLAWVLSVRGVNDPTVPGGRVIRDVPLLLIDDEADFASANTNEYRDEQGNIDEDAEPARTNGLIRKLLSAFEKSAYVGYTATPFANVFMHHEAYSVEFGEDLFPRSFIINIPAPSNYIGASKIFGLERPDGTLEGTGLPIVRPVSDAEAIFPSRHNKQLVVSNLPASLHQAVLAFMLACAARRARGDLQADNSMLVHVTRFTLVQEQVARLLDNVVVDIRRQLEFPGTGGNVEADLEALWRSDFEANAKAIRQALPDEDLPPVTWDAVRAQLFEAVKRIEVRAINGTAKDALDYVEHPQGLSVIAVGGDKLSRGLTLEGLSVSYFVRTSRMYDTLMQMGRWFGYRPRFADLCRLYTSPELVKWYRHIAAATAELREEFDLMFNNGDTPLQFGHRVRTHPDGLIITAANKMRAGAPVRAGFSGTISETVSFDTANSQKNLDTISELLERLPQTQLQDGRYIWNDIEGTDIAATMSRLETSRESWKANSKAIAAYVANRVAAGRLKKWTVVLVASGKASRDPVKVGPYAVSLVERENRSPEEDGKFTIARLVSPVDELLDLDPAAIERAMEETISAWEKKSPPKRDKPRTPSGPFIRKQRHPNDGLLLLYPIDAGPARPPLIGFAVSFPYDQDAPLIEYAENSVAQLEDFFS